MFHHSAQETNFQFITQSFKNVNRVIGLQLMTGNFFDTKFRQYLLARVAAEINEMIASLCSTKCTHRRNKVRIKNYYFIYCIVKTSKSKINKKNLSNYVRVFSADVEGE